MGKFESVLGTFMTCGVSKSHRIVFGPELLVLFEEEARLNLGVFVVRQVLPVLLAVNGFGEFWQFLAVDANCNVAKLRSHVFDHISSPSLFNVLHAHRREFFLLEPQHALLTLQQPRLRILMLLEVLLKLFEVVQRLRFSFLLENLFGLDRRSGDVTETRPLPIVLVVLHGLG